MNLAMHLVEAIEEFDAARYRAFRRMVWSALTRRSARMPVLGAERVERQAYRGVQEIPLDRIVGSVDVGRPADLDRGFLPTTTRVRRRWIHHYLLLLEGPELPPIEVRKVGEVYFVIDGHHRVSVYRTAGRATIRARVTEVWLRGSASAPANHGVSIRTRIGSFAGLAAGTRRLVRQRGGEGDLCWSCGQRSQHKLWCPNR